MFVDAYGAEAGNLALRSVSTGGVFIGGGIAPKILPALTDGRFLRAFVDKAPLRELLARHAGARHPQRRGRAARRGGLRGRPVRRARLAGFYSLATTAYH